jgi:hypothetical protein
VSLAHGFRSVRLAADFAAPVATRPDPFGVKKEPPILSRILRAAVRPWPFDDRLVLWYNGCTMVAKRVHLDRIQITPTEGDRSDNPSRRYVHGKTYVDEWAASWGRSRYDTCRDGNDTMTAKWEQCGASRCRKLHMPCPLE